MTVLTWSDAVETAMKPTDFDRKMDASDLIGRKKRINDEGTELVDPEIIRHRAATAYIEAHEGEEAEVEYINPEIEAQFRASGLRQHERAVWRTKGVLTKTYLNAPVFAANTAPQWRGFVVGGTLIPFNAVSAIRVESDHSIVVL